jgi:hypothetical protein
VNEDLPEGREDQLLAWLAAHLEQRFAHLSDRDPEMRLEILGYVLRTDNGFGCLALADERLPAVPHFEAVRRCKHVDPTPGAPGYARHRLARPLPALLTVRSVLGGIDWGRSRPIRPGFDSRALSPAHTILSDLVRCCPS